MNIVLVQGILSRDTEIATLPSGDRLFRYEVTVRPAVGSAESVPVTWLAPPKSARPLTAGTEVLVSGRVRRRFFRAGGATASRTEVAATTVVPAVRRARVRAVLVAAADAVRPGL